MGESDAHLGFVRSRLVRHSAEREHLDAPVLGAPDSGIVLIAGERAVLRIPDGPTAILGTDVLAHAGTIANEVFLGRIDGRAVHALAIAPEAIEAFPEPDWRLADLRGLAIDGTLAAEELGLLAAAKSLLGWHARNGFCANCGHPTESKASGFRRACAQCDASHFPRTDPVAIMLVKNGEDCLIGRGAHFPEMLYSCLAGFVEPGETIEDAVRRETAEETGVIVGAVRYRASQPWPFPSSLMIGCIAEAESRAITIDPVELADARWVDREELRLMFEGRHPEGLTVPRPMAIAHLLLKDFLDGVA